jgi:hypothetical protein
MELVAEVGPVDDPGDCHQRGVVRTVLVHQRLERASTMRVLVRVGGARSIEARRTLSSLDLGDLLGFHERRFASRSMNRRISQAVAARLTLIRRLVTHVIGFSSAFRCRRSSC